MKRKSKWLAGAVIIAAIAVVAAFMFEKVAVSAPAIALSEQGWRVNFSSVLQPEAVANGDIYLMDSAGEAVETEMVLLKNRQTIEIPQLPPGEYKLHIKNSAMAGSFFKTLEKDVVAFTVQEKIQTVSGEEELKAYFQQLIALQKNNEGREGFGESTEESSEGSGDSAEAGGDYSTTNQQVEGVDEADLVKTDGSYIYSISDNRVVISDIRKPDSLAVVDELVFQEEWYPQQLFLSGDVLVVLGNRYIMKPADGIEEGIYPRDGMTTVSLYDVKDPASPDLIRDFGTEGYLNGARLTDNVLYYVTNVYPNFWRMEEQGDTELRPLTYDSEDSGDMKAMAYDDLAILPGTMSGSYSIISSIDLSVPAENEVSTKGFLGGSEQLYMTKDHLYLTAAAYLPAEEDGQGGQTGMWLPQMANTAIFKFSLEGTDVQFLSTGEVAGTLLNQFSMDEHDGYFRIVTTEGFSWDQQTPSKNHLFVLDDGMKSVGSVQDLAKGERIYSARFIGDKAYMVTFKETDPLFVIDVSSPSAPKVLGELKIPGFSNYLHPLDENHLIGFGSDTKLEPVKDGEPRVVTGGMKISLFDISDFANPKEKDTEIIGGTGTYSPLQYDHKALFIHPDKNLYGFPVTRYKETGGNTIEFDGEGAMVFTITAGGIEKSADLVEPSNMQYEDWEKSVQRLLYSGNTLFTVANGELKSFDLETYELKDQVSY
jgi:uncharacterized secreted protein with C-terminal beta-propeller domain